MRKAYTKPALFAEAFILSEHISTGCAFETNSNASVGTKPLHGKEECAYQFDNGDMMVFNSSITQCEKPAYADQWTDSDLDFGCYTAFLSLEALFSS